MSKLQDIRDMAQEHAVSVSGSPRDWMDYMDTASRLYRYSFSDQLLIHAQHPEATACASLELWNEKMFRWVNRGARGIALLDETGQHTRLRYVFDISDTHMVAGGRSPYLWQMQEHQREEILTHLAEVYALEEKDTATLQDALMAVAREMVSDNLEEYLDGLKYAVEGTYLEDLDEVTIRSDFRQLATDSVYYLLSRRCGLDPMELLEEEDFMHITDYNRLSVLTFLGNTASQLSESILIDIGKTVHKISLEEARKEVENSNERNYNNFTTLMRETKNRDAETKKEENIENEGGTDYGTDISSQGRLPVSESDRRRGRSDDREIWDAAEDISERTQEQPLSEPVSDREAEQPSGTDRESSTGENGQPDGEITGEESGTGQGSRSDGMDSTHERTDGNSGREHLDGIGIQLVEDTREDGLSKAEEEIASALSLPEYPTANEQRRQIEERAAALYAGEIPIPEQVVDEILRTGGNRKASQLRIIYNFMSEQTPEEYTEFVKREYRKGGKGFQIDGNEYSVWFDETGMQIAVGHTVTDHILDKRKTAKYRNMPEHHTDPSEWIIHENTHEPIVAEPDFEEVQERWKKRSDFMKESVERGRSRWAGVEDSFPQKVKCMECGTTMTYMRYTNFGQSQGIRKGFYYCKEYDGKPGYCRQKAHEDLLKITVMDQIHNMIKVMCEKKVLLEKMREGTYDKGELVSLRVKIQNMQYRLAKAEETSATLYENFATGLLDEQEYLTLKEHYVQEKEKLEDGINQAQARKRMVEKSIDDFLEIEKNLEQYLDDRSFNQKLIDELVDKIYVSSKGMIEVRMKCSDVFQKVMEIME